MQSQMRSLSASKVSTTMRIVSSSQANSFYSYISAEPKSW